MLKMAANGSKGLFENDCRLKPGRRDDRNGSVIVTLIAVFKVLDFRKGKMEIAVGYVERLGAVFDMLTVATGLGELDWLRAVPETL